MMVENHKGGSMSSLGEEFPKQQTRVRKILGIYKALGASGYFGASWIEELLQRADQEAGGRDIVEMIRVYKELQGVKAW